MPALLIQRRVLRRLTPVKRNLPLGTITNTASPFEMWTSRELRFVLQSCARELLPGERVGDCLHMVIPVAQYVEIRRVTADKRAFYKNLAVCGSVWQCPVCAVKISEARRAELQAALNAWKGGLLMCTYTLSHKSTMSLSKTLETVKLAYRAGKGGKAYQKFKFQFGIVGSIRALEITFGANGWHPHVHELIFTEREVSKENQQQMYNYIWSHWSNTVKKEGQWAGVEHGINLTTADNDIAEYIGKWGHDPLTPGWGVARELTKQVSKVGSGKKGETPMQLLYCYFEGDKRKGNLWREYALTMKGSNQLVWSKGLRQLALVPQSTSDEEIAETEPANSILVAQLTRKQWRAILVSRMRGEVLSKAESLNHADFTKWLRELISFYTVNQVDNS